jgi:hypothetical protein
MKLDPHLLKITPLHKGVVTSESDIDNAEGVYDGLSKAMRKQVSTLTVPSGEGYEIEFWEIEIVHPFGKVMGNLKLVLIFSLVYVCRVGVKVKLYDLEVLTMNRYQAGFVNVKDGTFVIVEVPGTLGMKSWTHYTVDSLSKEDGSKGLHLVESSEVQCIWGFGKFIKKETDRAHTATHTRIIKELEERLNGISH